MLSEIGSNFWLNPYVSLDEKSLGSPVQFNCKGNDYVWLSTGRSAIQFVINTIEERNPDIKKVAVLPSFTCDTVFEPFLRSGYDVYYYPIERNLRTNSDAILETVFNHDASIVLFHSYFGFDTLDAQVDRMCKSLRGLGKYSIEDCTQCLYSNIRRSDSDYTVGSIRKWTGTPDGGFAVCRDGCFNTKPQKPDKDLESAKIRASYAKYKYLFEHEGEKSEMLTLYRAAEDIIDNQAEIFYISDISARVQANLNIHELANKRRINYALLSRELEPIMTPVFTLNEKDVPLYFPVLLDGREALQKYLVANAIYAPVVWPKDKKQPIQCDGAENAYKHLLCIPIDQRYGTDDMERVCQVLKAYRYQ